MDTSDTSWSNRTKPWERLRWARERAGLTQEAVAKAADLNRTAYIKRESAPDSSTRNTRMRVEEATIWAKLLKVRREWLLEGLGAPFIDETPAADRVRIALDGVMPSEEVEQIARMTELLDRKRTGTDS